MVVLRLPSLDLYGMSNDSSASRSPANRSRFTAILDIAWVLGWKMAFMLVENGVCDKCDFGDNAYDV